MLESYKPADRVSMKISILKMLKSCAAVWLLLNEQRPAPKTMGRHTHPARRGGTPLRLPFSPEPVRHTTGTDTDTASDLDYDDMRTPPKANSPEALDVRLPEAQPSR